VTAADRAAERAWELVASGADEVDGVRPQILDSWVRCRDEHGIDPARDRALAAEDPVLAPAESVAAAELGAAAMRLLPEATALGGVVVVADGRGRMLSAWGDEASAARGGEQNLGPLYSWAEPSVGTTGVATSLLARGGPATVRRFEHWCTAFHDWSCAAAAVTDADRKPLGVIGVSLWRRPLPDAVAVRLGAIAREVEGRLHPRLLERTGPEPAAPPPTRLVGVRAGRSVIVPVASVRMVALDDGILWLVTGEGRVRSAGRSIDGLERRLRSAGFVRVSRTALVNVEHVRELGPAFKSAVRIALDGVRDPVPVSRRRVPALRSALGI
jgi:transcriptional regulator of acetoin/glycerol metabolism